MNNKQYCNFINEQKKYFDEYIQPTFKGKWEDSRWYAGTLLSGGSGWLLARTGKIHFNFKEIKRLTGVKNIHITETYQEFIKAVLVLSYRKSNSRASPQKLFAEFLILKRWYSALLDEKPTKIHPCYLSTSVLNNSFEILIQNSTKTQHANHAGNYHRLQEIINYYSFTEQSLDFSIKLLYINSQNRTSNTLKTKALLEQLEIDEDEVETDKLITIRTFINIVSLINLCQTNGEKLILNFLLLLIVTGFRSTEAILLKKDALIKHVILDPVTNKPVTLDGVEQFVIGLRYHGAKRAGIRIHWVEPSSAQLVQSIFANVLDLTKQLREKLYYIRSKNCCNLLPKEIDDIAQDYVEIDDLIGTVFGVKDKTRGRAGQRDVVTKTLKNVPIYKEIKEKRGIKKYYLKKDINLFIKSLNNYDSEFPLHHIFNYEGKIEKIAFEDLLFIHEYRSTNLQRAFINKANILPLTLKIIDGFLGNGENLSVFKKYNLLENKNEYTKISTHIPRHNINTFLAISGLSEHLQAMLMGRIDVKQNQYYQHIALRQRRLTAGIFSKNESEPVDTASNKDFSPIESIKKDGIMYFSKNNHIENNLKRNLQTFDSRKETANYIKNSFFDGYFADISAAFNELNKENIGLADKLIERHAYLYPLPFGACMREVAIHSCPKRLSCQSGDQCGNFTLTGRKGELDAINFQIMKLSNEISLLDCLVTNDSSYKEMLDNLHEKFNSLVQLQEKSVEIQNDLIPVIVFPYDNIKLPNTLSELFAIEQQKIESRDN
ncbi:hypothetical protein OHV56_05995 [Acinetobacter baumannii]|nr:hypothetical protein [Acinetobacter baumannii]